MKLVSSKYLGCNALDVNLEKDHVSGDPLAMPCLIQVSVFDFQLSVSRNLADISVIELHSAHYSAHLLHSSLEME